MKRAGAALLTLAVLTAALPASGWAKSSGKSSNQFLSAKSAIVVDVRNGGILYAKNPHLRLPPASTTKLMTALVVLERLPLDRRVRVSARAAAAPNSKAGLTPGATYSVKDLVVACLVSSSNDAAVCLAEAAAGSESAFAAMMNKKAAQLGMKNTKFINASGLPHPKKRQYSTAFDLTLLMRRALRDPRIDAMLALEHTSITGSDGRRIALKSHNKMLWRHPRYVKGKTGWTFASRHTFVGTNYTQPKKIAFAMLSSVRPWDDIERLAFTGLSRQKAR